MLTYGMQSREQLQRLAELLGGLAILGCLPGSAAQRAGLRYGDIVLSVNGMATPNPEQYLRARQGAHTRVDMVVFRDGVERQLSVELVEAPAPGAAELLRLARHVSGDSGEHSAVAYN